MRLPHLVAVSALAFALSACGGQSSVDEPSTDTPGQATENAVAELTNSEFLIDQGRDKGACFTGSRFGACAVIKNVAKQWNSEGQLVPFGYNWDGALNRGLVFDETSGVAFGSIDPSPMGVGVMRIQSDGAGAVGSFKLFPQDGKNADEAQDGQLKDTALETSAFLTYIDVPSYPWSSNHIMCEFSGYVGCFVAEVFGGGVVYQPNSPTEGTDENPFPCTSGLCQQISGKKPTTNARHPQVNFTAITAPVAIEVKNNSNTDLTYTGISSGKNMTLSATAPSTADGAVVPAGTSAIVYGYRSLVAKEAVQELDLRFTTPDGAAVTTKAILASKDGVEAKSLCEVSAGSNITKRYSCDASSPSAVVTGSSAVNDSPVARVFFSIRS